MANKHRRIREAGDKQRPDSRTRMTSGSLSRKEITALVNAPTGKFLEALNRALLLTVSYPGLRKGLIQRRMKRVWGKDMRQKWMGLQTKKRIISKILNGENRAKYHFAEGLPEGKAELETELKRVNKEIGNILESL